jgi:hypothetical protein
MQYATTPAWMYVVLLVLGAAFILGDVIVLIGAPQAVGPVAWIWLAMSSGFILVAVQGLASARNDDRVRRTGIRARGTVLSATATRASVNRIPQWALALRVESGGIMSSWRPTTIRSRPVPAPRRAAPPPPRRAVACGGRRVPPRG